MNHKNSDSFASKEIINNDINNEIINIFNNPNVLPNGGFLGYGCKYLYSSVSTENITYKEYDAMIYNSFKSFGLNPIAEYISLFEDIKENEFCIVCNKNVLKNNLEIVNRNFALKHNVCLDCSRTINGQKRIEMSKIGSIFYTAPEEYEFIDADDIDSMVYLGGDRLVKDIYWINSPYNGEKEEALESEMLDENDDTITVVIYKGYTFLTYIPSYEKRQKGEFVTNNVILHKLRDNNDYDDDY